MKKGCIIGANSANIDKKLSIRFAKQRCLRAAVSAARSAGETAMLFALCAKSA
jgi:hypothetical protein